jgi:hypothetical protein
MCGRGQQFGAAAGPEGFHSLKSCVGQDSRSWHRCLREIPIRGFKECNPDPVCGSEQANECMQRFAGLHPFRAFHAAGTIDQKIVVMGHSVRNLRHFRRAQLHERVGFVAFGPPPRLWDQLLRLRFRPHEHKIPVRHEVTTEEFDPHPATGFPNTDRMAR